jgi:hypothetical protein
MTIGRAGNIFADQYKFAVGNADSHTTVTVTSFPASGSFIDVSGYERVHAVCKVATIHASDTPVITIKCSDANNGTLDVIDATLAQSILAANNGQMYLWTIEVAKLPVDHHFLAFAVSGTVSNGTYVDMHMWLEGPEVPVTQPAELPAANSVKWVG